MTENLTAPPRRETLRKPLISFKSTGLNKDVRTLLRSPTYYNNKIRLILFCDITQRIIIYYVLRISLLASIK